MNDYAPAAEFVRSTRKLDLPLPPAVLAAHSRHAALVAVGASLAAQRADSVTELRTALLDAGDDRTALTTALTGKIAQRLAAYATADTREALSAAIYQAETALRRAIVEHGDAVILGWRPTVEQAGADMAAAADALPQVDDLNDYEAVTRTGADAAEHWAKATSATALLGKVGQLLDALNALGYKLTPQPGGMVKTSVARMARLTWQHVDERTASSLWSAVGAGAEITLHTRDDLAALMAQLVADHEDNLTPIERSLRTMPSRNTLRVGAA